MAPMAHTLTYLRPPALVWQAWQVWQVWLPYVSWPAGVFLAMRTKS
jgi:hypothetical protein